MVNKIQVIGIIAIVIVVALAFITVPSEATVIVENGTLSPAELTVKQGTTVTWIIKGDYVGDTASDDMSSGHDMENMSGDDIKNKIMITSRDSGPVEGKYLFMSDHLSDGQNFSYTFNQKGTFHYYDMDHMDDKNLEGSIIVQ